MPATELLCYMVWNGSSKLTREEIHILEAELFFRLYGELKKFFKIKYQDYFHLMKFSSEMEDSMLEDNFARCVINDILSTEEYTLSGIACYTRTPEDVVYEVATGCNTSPSAKFLRRVIELHRSVRRDLYCEIMKKITTE